MMRSPIRRIAPLSVLALLLVSSSPAAAARPAVLVSFETSVEPFAGLSAPARESLGAHVAERVKSKCQQSFPLLDWAVAPGAPAPPAGWRWQVKVDEETRTVTLPNGQPTLQSITRLRHVVADPAGQSWELETGRATLYDFGRKRPSAAQRMQDDVDRLLEDQFSAEFLGKVGVSFLAQIQLADRIIVEAPTRLIVPLRRCDLRAGTESLLEVRFKKSGVQPDGILKLQAMRDVEASSGNAGFIYGPVQLLDLPPAHLEKPGYWHADFASILDSIRDVRVYMPEYKKDAAVGGPTDDGVILDLEPCGGGQ